MDGDRWQWAREYAPCPECGERVLSYVLSQEIIPPDESIPRWERPPAVYGRRIAELGPCGHVIVGVEAINGWLMV
jgi:hypothetical protein